MGKPLSPLPPGLMSDKRKVCVKKPAVLISAYLK